MGAFLTQSKIQTFQQPFLGTVEEAIAPKQRGRVQCFGSYWPARWKDSNCQETLVANQPIQVVGRDGITLLVETIQSR